MNPQSQWLRSVMKTIIQPPEDLEAWRNVFEEAANDPDFKIFTHPNVEIEVIPVGKIVAVE